MADEHDIAGIAALLIRVVRLERQIVREKKAILEAQQRVKDGEIKTAAARSALTAFGVPAGEGSVWERARSVIGVDRYKEAHAMAVKIDDDEMGIQHDEAADSDGASLERSLLGDPLAGKVLEEVDSPKVSDAILEFLRQRPSGGAKVGEIRAHLKEAYGLDVHEKTPGMTLYRLAQQVPPLVRLDGRIWFSVSVDAETKNPGAATPGSDEKEKE